MNSLHETLKGSPSGRETLQGLLPAFKQEAGAYSRILGTEPDSPRDSSWQGRIRERLEILEKVIQEIESWK